MTGHFKVYKTQYWMSRWSQELKKNSITYEWNTLFATLGHNYCDGHAGHLKRQVKAAEANYQHMYSVDSIVPCMKKVKNTTSVVLTKEEIEICEEDIVKCVGAPWIKKYHHFKYTGLGVVSCQYIRGEGIYNTERMKQLSGVREKSDACGICGNTADQDDDEGASWLACDKCEKWYHCACVGMENFCDSDDDDEQSEQSFYFECHKCLAASEKKSRKKSSATNNSNNNNSATRKNKSPVSNNKSKNNSNSNKKAKK